MSWRAGLVNFFSSSHVVVDKSGLETAQMSGVSEVLEGFFFPVKKIRRTTQAGIR
jgi:hypothetical protein